jgi:hypothetical protein
MFSWQLAIAIDISALWGFALRTVDISFCFIRHLKIILLR